MKRTLRLISLFLVFCSIVCVADSGASAYTEANLRETRLASSIQATFSPEILISTSAQSYWPAVAHNDTHDEYLVVWHNEEPGPRQDVAARRVSAQGEPLFTFTVATGGRSRLRPAVAYNSTEQEYLVVWMLDVHGNGSAYEIWGRLVAWDGSHMGPEFQIITFKDRSFFNPRVAWNSVQNQYLVIWTAKNTKTGYMVDVSSMLLGPDGAPITGRNLTIGNHPQEADLVYNPVKDEYFVVFVRVDPQAITGTDIYGLRVAADNYVIDPPGAIMISAEPSNQEHPAVATNGRFSYAVVWMTMVGTDFDIRALKLDFNGNKPWGDEILIAATTVDEVHPAIASNGKGYVTAWERDWSTIEALYWDIESPQLIEVTATSPYYCASNATVPAVSAGSTRFLFTYEAEAWLNWPECLPRIYGRLWSPYGVFLPLVLTSP